MALLQPGFTGSYKKKVCKQQYNVFRSTTFSFCVCVCVYRSNLSQTFFFIVLAFQNKIFVLKIKKRFFLGL